MPVRPYTHNIGFDTPTQYAPEPLTPEAKPGMLGIDWQNVSTLPKTWGAAFEVESPVVAAWDLISAPIDKPDPTFNLESNLKEAGLWEDYRWNFVGVRSAAEFLRKSRKITKELEARKTLAAAGPDGVVAAMGAGLLSPTTLLPFVGPATRGYKAVALGAAWGGAGGVLDEIPLQLNQELRTMEESGLAVGFSTVLGGVLGGGVGFLNRSLDDLAADMAPAGSAKTIPTSEQRVLVERRLAEIDQTIAKLAPDDTELVRLQRERQQQSGRLRELDDAEKAEVTAKAYDDAVADSALGNKAAGGGADVLNLDAGGLKNMLGIGEKLTVLGGPVTAVLGQKLSSTGRRIMAELATAGLRLEGNSILDRKGNVIGGMPSNQGGTIEAMINQRRGATLAVLDAADEAHADYFFGQGGGTGPFRNSRAGMASWAKGKETGKLNRTQFMEEVGKAMIQGDLHPIPEVQKTAQTFRKYYDQLLAEAQDAGLISREIEEITPDLSFINRIYDTDAIKRNPAEFKRLLAKHFEETLTADLNRIHERFAKSEARDTQRLADMDLPLEKAQALREQYLDELKALDEADDDDLSFLEDLISKNRAALAENTRARKKAEAAAESGTTSQRRASKPVIERLAQEREEIRTKIEELKGLGGDDLEQRRLYRANLKSRIRGLNRSRFMVEEKARAKYDKISDLEDQSIEALEKLMHQGHRALKRGEDEADAFAADLAKMRANLGQAGQRTQKYQQQISELAEAEAAQAVKEKNYVYVIHGGSDFTDIDPKFFGSGEPGGIRPLGNGLYGFVINPDDIGEAGRAIDGAKRYAEKYGKGPKKLHIFKVPSDATATFNGQRVLDFKSADSPEEAAYYNALGEADKIPRGPERKAAYDAARLLEPAAMANKGKPQVRGERLPGNLTELAIHDLEIAARVGKFDTTERLENVLMALEKDSESKALQKLFKAEQNFEKANARFDELADDLESFENINFAEGDRRDAEALIQEAVTAAAERVNRFNTSRAQRIKKLEDQIEKMDVQGWQARRTEIQQRIKARREKTRELVETNLGGRNYDEVKGTADFSARAAEIAALSEKRILGTNMRLAGYDAMRAERGTELARALSIPSKVLQDAGFLVTDAKQLLHIYAQTLIPDIEITNRLGPFAPDGERNFNFQALNDEMDQVRASYEAKVRASGKPVDEEKLGAELKGIYNEYAKIRENIDAVIRRLRHQWGLPDNPEALAERIGTSVLMLQAWRFLGGTALAQFSDLAKPVARYGLLRTMRHAWLPMLRDWTSLKMTAQDARQAFVAIESATADRAFQLTELLHRARRKSKFEAGAEFATSKIGIVFGFAPVTDLLKTVSAMAFNSKLMDSIDLSLNSVKTSKDRLEAIDFLNSLGLSQGHQQRIWDQMQNGGAVKRNGTWIPETAKWTDPIAVRHYRAALNQETSASIVTPGVEVPKWTNRSTLMRLLANLKSFALASTSKTLMAGLQQRDAAVANAIWISLALGAFSYYLRSTIAGGAAEERMRKSVADGDWELWVDEALDASGILGVLSIAQNIGDNIPGVRDVIRPGALAATLQGKNANSTIRSQAGSLIEDAAGPSADFLFTSAQIMTGLDKVDRAQIHRVRTLLPMQNVFYLRRLFDQIENNLGDAVNAPGKRR